MTAEPLPCVCPFHDDNKALYKNVPPWPGLPELHPIIVDAGPADDYHPQLAWACLPCCNRMVKAGDARRCIEERG